MPDYAQTMPEVSSREFAAKQSSDQEHGKANSRLCGAVPVPIYSGKTNRMRLHRGGDRDANKTLHLIAVAPIRTDPRTKVYMERRRGEGLSKRDVLRCLKRFIAREAFNALKRDLLQD